MTIQLQELIIVFALFDFACTQGFMEPLITSDPRVMLGKPVIAGTRITVELILEKLGAGETVDDLLLDYPRLTREAVSAAVRFAPIQPVD